MNIRRAFLVPALAALSLNVAAQNYPSKPIKSYVTVGGPAEEIGRAHV